MATKKKKTTKVLKKIKVKKKAATAARSKSTEAGRSRGKSRKYAVSRRRDQETVSKIGELGSSVVKLSLAEKDPFVDIPIRTVGNTAFNDHDPCMSGW